MYLATDMDTVPTLALLRTIAASRNTDRFMHTMAYPPNVLANGGGYVRPVPSKFLMPLIAFLELGGVDEDFNQARFHDDTTFAMCWSRQFKHGGMRSRRRGKTDMPPMIVTGEHVPFDQQPGHLKVRNQEVQRKKRATGNVCNTGPVLRAPWRVVYQQG